MSPYRLLAVITTFGPALLVGCDSTCKDLSETICNCEPTELKQQACLQRVDDDAQYIEVTEDELERCAEILSSNSCTCDALAEGELQACGLANES